MTRRNVFRVIVYLATALASWALLSVGTQSTTPNLQPGAVAQQDYTAQTSADVRNQAAYEEAMTRARENVEPVTERQNEAGSAATQNAADFFSDVADAVVDESEVTTTDPVSPSLTVGPEPTVTTAPETTRTETTTTDGAADGAAARDGGEGDSPEDQLAVDARNQNQPQQQQEQQEQQGQQEPEGATISGSVYLDLDDNGRFTTDLGSGDVEDVVAEFVPILATDADGKEYRTTTVADGGFMLEDVTPGETIIRVSGSAVPDGFTVSGGPEFRISCASGATCDLDPIALAPALLPPNDAVALLSQTSSSIQESSLEVLVQIASDDVRRMAVGGESQLQQVQNAVIGRLDEEFRGGILQDEIDDAIAELAANPPTALIDGEFNTAVNDAAGDVVAAYLVPNMTVNEAETEELRDIAAEAVSPEEYTTRYQANEIIVRQGQTITQQMAQAVTETGDILQRNQVRGGLFAVIAVLVATLGFYLSRWRPDFWSRSRMVALLGLLIVLMAASIRLTSALAPQASGYILPAVAFGFLTAILFDSRIGVLMAIAMGILTAAGTRDPGIVVYGVLATLIPIGFVSAVSTRNSIRSAVVYASLASGGVAAATSWFFHSAPPEPIYMTVAVDAAWATGISVLVTLVGFSLIQYLEGAFDVTTTMGLLDLTDRNHEALQLLQEKAFGTFNHSLMVGTLADAAARSIDANPLLARAMAYYHDLGKTEQPIYFIENQFGITNPHDELSPRESAAVVRSHVTDGVRLARKYGIPSEVVDGILSHHGDAIMRYFYEEAREEEGEEVDPIDFRHAGHKPRTEETAILMLADSVEASCRAVFQDEEPAPHAIEKLITRIVDEKVNDGQLSEAPLTMAQMTTIKRAFLDALVGHYHQRIQYPNFPG
ncbi:MAG: HDIG domain-containing protein [Acidimicrobiia bacterium]|nr:HDIG domain-containing protein [Acidimicrobiia bacterium]